MRQIPGWGWRGPCVLLAGGLASSAALADSPAPPDSDSGIVLTSATVPQPRRAAPPLRPQPERSRVPTLATPGTSTHADVLNAARQLEQQGRLIEAQRAYQAVLAKYPQHVDCLHRLGVVCTRLNEFDAARAHYDRAMLLSPKDVALLADAGFARYLAGDYRQSEKLLRKAVELSPHDARANNNLAVLLGVTGRFDESLQRFQQVNPPAKALTNLAYVYQLRSEPDQALICYQRAREIDTGVVIPEDLLAQTLRTEPLVTEADLPPAPEQVSAVQPTAAPKSTATVVPPKAITQAQPAAQPIAQAQPAAQPAAQPIAQAQPAAQPAAQPVAQAQAAAQRTASPPAKAAAVPPSTVPDWATTAPFEAPAVAERTAEEDPFQAPLPVPSSQAAVTTAAVSAPALAFEPELQPDTADGTQPKFEPPIVATNTQASHAATFPADSALDPTEMAWLASERAKLVRRAHWEGVKGYCLVTLMEERRLSEAHDEFVVEHQGQTYTFASAEAAERFRSSPETYIPAAGGLDIVSVHHGNVVSGSLDHSAWYRERLYLFASVQTMQEFRKDPKKFVKD